jgi:YD repeat-containing protein
VISDNASSSILSGPIYSFLATSYEANGNLQSSTDSIMGRWGYGYGIASYRSYSGQNMSWSYDSFGNRLAENRLLTPSSSSQTPITWDGYDVNNRVSGTTQAPSGYVYDAAGNVVQDGINQYAHDGDGRLCAV